ncbi:MAG: conjugal transfer protein TraD [Sphingomonas sp.]
MRKPRDFDSELKALGDKAKQLRERKLHQLGEVVIATGADALPPEQLAGALLAATEMKDHATKEGWRKRGAAFFQGAARNAAGGDRRAARGTETGDRGAPSSAGQDRT